MKITRLCCLALLLLVASLSAAQQVTRCGDSATALYINSTTFHFDVCHTGNNPYERILSPVTVRNLVLNWKTSTLASFDASPAVFHGEVYIGNSFEGLYSLNAYTGETRWFVSESGTTAAIANGLVYIGSYKSLWALNIDFPIPPQWTYTASGTIDSSPTVADGRVYFGSQDGNMYAVDALTGALLWKKGNFGNITNSSPAVVNGLVYVGAVDGSVYALNSSTGETLWSYPTGALVESSPAVVNGVVYIGSSDQNLYALNALTGTLLWKYATGGPVYSSPAVANGVVYVGSWDQNLHAVDAATGAPHWKYPTGGLILSSPFVANGVVYVGSKDHNIYALDASSGALLWKYTTGDMVDSSPVVVNGALYVGGYDANIYAFHLPSQ